MRQPTAVPGSLLAAALVVGGLLGGGLLAGCQRQESQPSGQATAPTAQASPPAAQPAAPGPAGASGAVPVPAAPASIEAGKQLFAQNCATCHGSEGKGDGPAAVALNPKPADLTDTQWKYGGSPQEVFRTVSNGVPGTAMVSWASIPEKDRWNLVNYVLSLSKKK